MQNKQQILISIAIFVATMFGGVADAHCPLEQINREIACTVNSIDSVRNAHSRMMARILRKNSNYRYIRKYCNRFDSLTQENDRLMNTAIQLIHNQYHVVLIPRTSNLFIRYRDIPGMLILGDIYSSNMQKIKEYKQRVSAFQPEYQAIKNRCDSIRNAQIEMYQLRLDSLLNVKLELTR